MAHDEKQVLESGASSTLSPEHENGIPDDAHSEVEKMDSGHQRDLAMRREEEAEQYPNTVRRPPSKLSFHPN